MIVVLVCAPLHAQNSGGLFFGPSNILVAGSLTKTVTGQNITLTGGSGGGGGGTSYSFTNGLTTTSGTIVSSLLTGTGGLTITNGSLGIGNLSTSYTGMGLGSMCLQTSGAFSGSGALFSVSTGTNLTGNGTGGSPLNLAGSSTIASYLGPGCNISAAWQLPRRFGFQRLRSIGGNQQHRHYRHDFLWNSPLGESRHDSWKHCAWKLNVINNTGTSGLYRRKWIELERNRSSLGYGRAIALRFNRNHDHRRHIHYGQRQLRNRKPRKFWFYRNRRY